MSTQNFFNVFNAPSPPFMSWSIYKAFHKYHHGAEQRECNDDTDPDIKDLSK